MSPSTATADATRCIAVASAEDGSRWIIAAATKPAPARPSAGRALRNTIASAIQATPLAAIATSTMEAAGRPGIASRLIVVVVGS